MPEGMCIFCEGMHAFRQVLWAPCMCRCRCVHYTGVVNISVYICVHACYRVCICAHVCAVCSFSVREQGWRGPTSLWGHLLLGEGGYFWQKERWGYCLCLLFFNAGGSLRGVGVCILTHTHTAHIGYSDVSPRVGMRHLEGLKNPDALNLGICVFVNVCKLE